MLLHSLSSTLYYVLDINPQTCRAYLEQNETETMVSCNTLKDKGVRLNPIPVYLLPLFKFQL